jgi:hypothetical protein
MRTTLRAMLLVGALTGLALGATAADKGTVVTLDNLKSTAPANWKEETPSNKMRFAQFLLPRAEGDKADAQLVIFKGFGGSAKANVDRWKGQFLPPQGKTIDDVAQVKELKVAGNPVTYLDIHGTYLDGPPMLPASKKMKRPNWRMLAVQFEGPKNNYHILVRGPAKTIEKHRKGFDEWIKGFK